MNKLADCCMAIGAVLVLAALSLFVFNQWEDRQVAKASMDILPRLIQQIQHSAPVRQYENVCSAEAETEAADPVAPAMTAVELDGNWYIGVLTIPVLDVELPVMSDWSDLQLKTAPCRYSGSIGSNDLVIAAHNYSSHFGRIGSLFPGDAVYFTDMDGIVTKYAIVAVDILEPTAVEDMTAGEFDLTLFTCTYGGQSRLVVRCNQAAEE